MPLPDVLGVRALHAWLDTWLGIGDIEVSAQPGRLSSLRSVMASVD